MKKFYCLLFVFFSLLKHSLSQNGNLFEPDNYYKGVFKFQEKRNLKIKNRIEKLNNRYVKKILYQDSIIQRIIASENRNLQFNASIGSLNLFDQDVEKLDIGQHITEQQERLYRAIQFARNVNNSKHEKHLSALDNSFVKLGKNNKAIAQLEQLKVKIADRQLMWNELKNNKVLELQNMRKLENRFSKKLNILKQKNELLSKAENQLLQKLESLPGFDKFFIENSSWAGLFQLNRPFEKTLDFGSHMQTLSMNEGLSKQIGQLMTKNQNSKGDEEIEKQIKKKDSIYTKDIQTREDNSIIENKIERKGKFEVRFQPDIQFTSSNSLIPTLSQIGFNAIIKPNGKSFEVGQAMVMMIGWPNKNSRRISIEGIGYRSFFQWPIFRETKLYSGLEFSLLTSLIPEGQAKYWTNYIIGSGLVGLTRTQNIGKQKFDLLVAYNLFYKQNPLQLSPWVVRTGINLFNRTR